MIFLQAVCPLVKLHKNERPSSNLFLLGIIMSTWNRPLSEPLSRWNSQTNTSYLHIYCHMHYMLAVSLEIKNLKWKKNRKQFKKHIRNLWRAHFFLFQFELVYVINSVFFFNNKFYFSTPLTIFLTLKSEEMATANIFFSRFLKINIFRCSYYIQI